MRDTANGRNNAANGRQSYALTFIQRRVGYSDAGGRARWASSWASKVRGATIR